jgi:sortase A
VRVATVIGWAGRMMIRGGVLVLLFVVYQLWGTAIHTAQAQDRLQSEFEELIDAASTTTTTADTLPAPTEPTPAPADLPAPAPGGALGRILIPDIGVDFYILEGVDLRYLESGPGHFPNTPMPGQPGNAALAGHRTTFAAPFHRLDELDPGDQITVDTVQGSFTYEVMPQEGAPGEPPSGHFIVGPTQVEILDDFGDNRLTLMACHPKYSAAQRIVVSAELVSTPAPPTPPPATGLDAVEGNTFIGEELAGGDRGALPGAIAWTLAVVAVWVGAWLVGRRWPRGRWVAYAAAFPVWLAFLYAAFTNINNLLPNAY